MKDSPKIIPKFIETQENKVSNKITPGSIILERDTGRVSFDASDGKRYQVKDPTKLSLEGGTLKGDLNLGSHRVTKDYVEGNLLNTDDSDLLNRGEVAELFDAISGSYIESVEMRLSDKVSEDKVTQMISDQTLSEDDVSQMISDQTSDKVSEDKVTQMISDQTLSEDDVSQMISDQTSDKLSTSGGALLEGCQITKNYVEGSSQGLDDSDLVNKGEVSEMIGDQGSGDTSQADYDEFDEMSKSFIKNKPFYNNTAGKQISGEIVKNLVEVDSYIYTCDKIGLAKNQSEDLLVTISADNPDNPEETMTVPGLVMTYQEILDRERPGQYAGPLSDVLCLCIKMEVDGVEEVAEILMDGVEFGGSMPQLSDTSSVVIGYDSVVVNSLNTQDVKYLDPLFIKPYRPDCSVVDKDDPRYISNKVVERSFHEMTISSEDDFVYTSSSYYHIIQGYGVTSREDSLTSEPDQYVLTINYGDGTTVDYTTEIVPSATLESLGLLDNQQGNPIYRQVLLNPDDPGDKSQRFFIESTCGLDENTLITISQIQFHSSLDIKSWTLSGRFKTMTCITMDMVQGLNEVFEDMSDAFVSTSDYQTDKLTLDSRITSVQKDSQSLNNYLGYMISRDIAWNLHYAPNLSHYLSGGSAILANVTCTVNFVNYSNPLFPLGTSSKPFEIAATNLTECFYYTQFRDSTYEDYPDIPLNIYLKLLNAEVIDKAFIFSNLRYYKSGEDYTSEEEVQNTLDLCVILCHDITSAKSTFYGIDYEKLKLFKFSGDPALGRRVKIYGTDNRTFRLSSQSNEYATCEFVFENLEFMDSINFAYGVAVPARADVMVNIIDQLHDYSLDEGDLPTDKYCTFGSSGRSLLSEDQIKVATDKGWTIN